MSQSTHANTAVLPKAFVIGWPIAHSKSPTIHTHWLKQNGLSGSYEKIAVEPCNLERFVGSLKDNGFVGGNVTIPHKEAILSFVDVVHTNAKRLRAANTVWFEGGKLHADTTDGYGFLSNLDQHQPNWDQSSDGKALVLGAGGASRPIINGLIERGFKTITLVNRTKERAESLVETLRDLGIGSSMVVGDWQDRSELLAECSLLVNTSSLGMVGQPPLDLSLDALPSSALVTDIVYTPLETNLLRDAKARGNVTVDGLGMLLHQAVPGFEHWFGVRPAVTDELRQLVLSTT
ncbi:shikimate dehydrogenase [Cohaesibacter celericrescens]|uniref:shikimate dehydrogenase n=1 Tax=Cohaesibacter celericrescens TaxID=2067669 RepID=UPI00356AEBD6